MVLELVLQLLDVRGRCLNFLRELAEFTTKFEHLRAAFCLDDPQLCVHRFEARLRVALGEYDIAQAFESVKKLLELWKERPYLVHLFIDGHVLGPQLLDLILQVRHVVDGEDPELF